MVTILPKEKDFGDYLGEAVSGFIGNATQSYQNRHDEMALQKAIESLPPDATPRQRLDAITGAKVYNPASKKNAYEAMLGTEKLEELQRHHKQTQDIQKANQSIAEHKLNLEENKMFQQTQENQIKRNIEEKKVAEERASIKNIVNSIPGIPEEQKEALGESLNRQGAQKLLENSFKEPNQTDFEKNVEKINAQKYVDLSDEIEKVKGTLETLDHLQGLVDSLGVKGTAAGLLGLSGTATEIEGIGFTVVEPIFKLLNPGGGILAAYKVKEAQNKFGVKATDAPWTKNAKIRALKLFSKNALSRANKKLDLIKKYNGKPPPGVIEQFDKESETLSDAALDYDLVGEEATGLNYPPADKYKGQTFDTPDGRIYSDGTRWLKKPQ